ncbi:hypothetical protein K439DRAFT_1649758 [Ramaria rubella]|nr:hypothetical protein K439DRAFT_1649758 [Ramaria rubella]
MDQSVEEDGFDGDMPIPRSVLHECNESFIAADEALIKASMIFFDNTGIMALLCHHDHVLWVANMKSTGEKQFYAITLLLTLLQHLPTQTKVGTFYDIACKLHESAIKWGFFGDTLKQMTFSVSVFHAYGFGLSDGEGCEHLWSMLKHLIPVLRVSGDGCNDRIATSTWCSKALQDLAACGVPEEVLRAEWEAQSNKQGTKAVEQVLLLREARTAAHERNDKLSHCLKCLEAALGVDQMANLQGMRNSAYLCNRMNARALKNCLRSKLREQRFELARIEHSYTHSVNENKLHDHTEEQIKCKEPRIKELVWKDNKLCLSLAQHIESKCAPPNSFAPMQINLHGVFQIDINDPIWVDVGDNNVRSTITAMLELDRCEEFERLKCEQTNMQTWFSDEWATVKWAYDKFNGLGDNCTLAYHLQEHLFPLCELCETWHVFIDDMPAVSENLPAWGPTNVELEVWSQ